MTTKIEQPTYFAIIPANVRYDSDIVPNAKLLYGELTCLSNKKGYCYASNSYFAALYDVKINTISIWINSLVEKEYVRTEITNKNERKIYINPHEKKGGGSTKKREGGSTKKDDPLYKSNISKNKTSIKLSKDNYVSSSKIPNEVVFKSSFVKGIVLLWNDIDYTSNILVTKQSKTTITIEKYIKQLLKGSFTKNNIVTSLNNLPMMHVIYTKEQITKGIKDLALYFKGGYWPQDKSRLPKSLVTLLYNPHTQKSLFLSAIKRPPRPLTIAKNTKDPYPEITKRFTEPDEYMNFQALNGSYNPDNINDVMKLRDGIDSIVDFYNRIPDKVIKDTYPSQGIKTIDAFCKRFHEWLYNQQNWLTDLQPKHITANNKIWKKFIKDFEKEKELSL